MLARARPPGSLIDVVPRTQDATSLFCQFWAFHSRDSLADPCASQLERVRAAGDTRASGFHQMLTALAEYPELLRRLGLVFDLEVPADGFPSSFRGQLNRLRVVPSSSGPPPPAYTPVTHYLFYPTPKDEVPLPLFCAAPTSAGDNLLDAELVFGLLNLQRNAPRAPTYDIMQVDVDGTVLKAIDTISGIVAADQAEPPIDQPTEVGVPSIRTGGLSVTWADHADALSLRLQNASKQEDDLSQGVNTPLFAEDLVRGYRVDIRPVGPAQPGPFPWRSLNYRIGTYSFPQATGGGAITLTDIADEGYVQPTFAQRLDSSGGALNSATAYVQESLFHWLGWGLSVPRPTKPVDTSPDQSQPSPSPQPGGLQLQCDFHCPDDSLPRLRFGWNYQIRIRAVDLAGNSLSVNEADTVIAAIENAGVNAPILPAGMREFAYRRYEPVHAPELVLRTVITEGESPETLVIRSNVGVSAPDYAASLNDPKYQGVNERHVAPQRHRSLWPSCTACWTGLLVPPEISAPITTYAGKRKARSTKTTSMANCS